MMDAMAQLTEDQRVYVEGEVHQNSYENEMGRQYKTEIIVSDMKVF